MVNLRYRQARDFADQLGQVFTPAAIADLLVRSIPAPDGGVTHVLDLGAGAGALTAAALRKHPKAHAWMIETDPSLVATLEHIFPGPRAICADALGWNWNQNSTPSWIISNPPYGYATLTDGVRGLVSASRLHALPREGWLRGDVAFVTKAWSLAVIGTGLGLIVASPMVSDPGYRAFRTQFLAQMKGLIVTQLAEKTFPNTEVRAYLITGSRAVSRRRGIVLRKATVAGKVVDEIEVGFDEGVSSLDIDYHRTLQRLGIRPNAVTDTLASVGTTIVRGSRSNGDYKRLGLAAFHTSDLENYAHDVRLTGALSGYQVAGTGDILIARVGTRCLIRQARVAAGAGLYTDCVFRLGVKPRERTRVWKTLISSYGAQWRLAHAAGSCAKHLTVQTLATMPLLPR